MFLMDQIEVEPIREHLSGADRGGEHQGGGGLVLGEEIGLHLQV